MIELLQNFGAFHSSAYLPMEDRTQEREILWQNFKQTGDMVLQHQIVMEYIWIVKYVLKKLHLPTNTILTEDDFFNVGVIGLLDAVKRFEPDRGVKFESFTVPRIKGIVRDELRKIDWLSRTTRKRAKEFNETENKLKMEKGRDVTSDEVLEKLNISKEHYNLYMKAAFAARSSLSLQSNNHLKNDEENGQDNLNELPDGSQPSSLDNLVKDERLAFISGYLKKINRKKRLVISLYYYEELTFREIGKLLNISESRVCQIHSEVISTLKKLIQKSEK